jgi:hypothetical protein
VAFTAAASMADLEPAGIRCRVEKRVAVKASTAVASAAAADFTAAAAALEVEGTVSLCS